jgi:chromosomal replication initiation ATPase DnaA
MENTILKAKLILAQMFGIGKIHFEKHKSRKTNINEARRFLIYFLRKELNVTFTEICKYVPALTNHATAMHHHKRMKELLEVEAPILRKYEEFKETLLSDETLSIQREIIGLRNTRTNLTAQITKLKKLL